MRTAKTLASYRVTLVRVPVALAFLAVGEVVESGKAAIALSSADALQALTLAGLLLAELALVNCSASVAVAHLTTSMGEAKETGGAFVTNSTSNAFTALALPTRGIARAGDRTSLVAFAGLGSPVEPGGN